MIFLRFEEYMLPCLNKKIFGMDCMGCGLQRATAFLFSGEFVTAFKMYPAIYTLILLILVVVFNLFIKFKYSRQVKITLIGLNLSIIIGFYLLKIWWLI